MKRKSIPIELLVGGFVLGVAIVGSIIPHTMKNTYTVTITDKQVKRSNDSDKYLIYTKTDGKTRVFKNTDSLLEGKFNSADVYAELEIGKTYDIETYGYRIPFCSMYENIVDVEEK